MKWFEKIPRNIRKLVAIVFLVISMALVSFWEFNLFTIALFIFSLFLIGFDIAMENEERKKEEQTKKLNALSEINKILEEQAESTIVSNVEFPIYTKVRGVTFNNRQQYLEDSCQYDDILIKHIPQINYPEAMIVVNQRTEDILGHLSADLANQLLNVYGKGCKFYGIIEEITGGGNDKNLGCNISISGIEY